ncbi:hypothetical protein MSG28_014212 [Choristoneura fumiferana]|uniref:Uncharacterized protein n=1 Tax=Choristoneura fumiferana TaxID=7141 RepID=A0ACC0JGB6_CHOFU|nr:hypothetical protein MSG28_014212 [Choristoneura fumiferana]
MTACFYFLIIFCLCPAESRNLQKPIEEVLNQTRRILNGREVGETMPYMVYLRPALSPPPADANWLCGGVIIHPRYILTSAACIEDVKHFYVISGTHRWIPLHDKSDPCIVNGAKKAVWKCVPKSYVFDGNDFNNIRWMVNDIAVVKVEEDFNFKRRIKGCDFIPKMVSYNNQSLDLEKPGTTASVAGWGSKDRYGDKNCKKRWPERYHYIIDGYMICGKDGLDSENMNQLCTENEVNCKEMLYSDTEEEEEENPDVKRRLIANPEIFEMNPKLNANETRRAKSTVVSGGFCENDHGGPLIVGHGTTAVVIGIISASLTKDITQKCYGPFLYTSNDHGGPLIVGEGVSAVVIGIISACLVKDRTNKCYGPPAKNEIAKMRRMEEEKRLNQTLSANATSSNSETSSDSSGNSSDSHSTRHPHDEAVQHGGVVLRTFEEKPSS